MFRQVSPAHAYHWQKICPAIMHTSTGNSPDCNSFHIKSTMLNELKYKKLKNFHAGASNELNLDQYVELYVRQQNFNQPKWHRHVDLFDITSTSKTLIEFCCREYCDAWRSLLRHFQPSKFILNESATLRNEQTTGLKKAQDSKNHHQSIRSQPWWGYGFRQWRSSQKKSFSDVSAAVPSHWPEASHQTQQQSTAGWLELRIFLVCTWMPMTVL